MNRKKAIVLRARLAFLAMCLAALAILGRLAFLQIVQGPKWRAELQKRNVQERVIIPTRGNIYSDNGGLLATSLPRYRLAMNPHPKDLPDTFFRASIDSLAYLLSIQFKDKSAQEYKAMIKKGRAQGRKFLYLSKETFDYSTKKKIKTWPLLRRTRHIAGAIFEKSEHRYTPFGELAARTVGYINEDNKGVGLEASFDAMLGGTAGKGIFRRIAGGYWKPLVEISSPHSGFDIQTTIDINIQDVAETALKNAMEKHRANFGCVVLMKTETGEIKAMANMGLNKDGTYGESYNYAVARRTAPGSTMKLAAFMAMLEEGCIEPTDTVDAERGVHEFYGVPLRDSHEGGWGRISASQVFSKSSNIGTAKMVIKCFGQRPQKFLDYLQKFGLNTPLNFQIKGEARPLIRTMDDRLYSLITVPWTAVGYECEMSPLQVLTFYNAVANGGTIMQPYIVKEVRDGKHVIQSHEPKVLGEKIASEKTLKIVHDMLIEVVENGTAANIKNTEYTIAGKTGTSQKRLGKNVLQKYYTSFCGYFPADKPKYSCIVVIDEPKGPMQHGADVAAPVFKEVSEKVNSLEIDMHKPLPVGDKPLFANDLPRIGAGHRADLKNLCNLFGVSNFTKDSVGEWVSARAVNEAVLWKPVRNEGVRLPDVKGMTLRDALFLIENKGYRVRHFGEGRVTQMSPAPGRALARGATVSLMLK